MKLWSDNTAKLAKLPKLRATEGIKFVDKVAVAKFFATNCNYTWYVIEGEKTQDGDWRFFGFVTNGKEKQFGHFTLSQLEILNRDKLQLIKRDKYFSATKVSEL